MLKLEPACLISADFVMEKKLFGVSLSFVEFKQDYQLSRNNVMQ